MPMQVALVTLMSEQVRSVHVATDLAEGNVSTRRLLLDPGQSNFHVFESACSATVDHAFGGGTVRLGSQAQLCPQFARKAPKSNELG